MKREAIVMIQRPNAAGLVLCEKAIIEEGTRNVTLVNVFYRLASDAFPSPPQHLTVHTLLTDGLGVGRMELVISRLDMMTEIYHHTWQARFQNPLHRLRYLIRIASCSFPGPGRYQFELRADGEPIAQCLLDVSLRRKTDG
jgi:hypothetical protein